MIQLSTTGVTIECLPDELESLRTEFAQLHTVKLKQFLDPDLIDLVFSFMRDDEFQTKIHGELALELALVKNIGVHSIQLLLNHDRTREIVEKITGASPLQYFSGRIYRLVPGAGHYDTWHDDAVDGRRVGMSINLSPLPYEGGTFEIKHRDTDSLIRTLPNLGLGDAIIFRLGENFLHRVTPVEGAHAKTAFAGWFHDEADFQSFLKPLAQSNSKTTA